MQGAAAQALVVLAVMQPLNAVTFIGDGIFQGAADFRYLAGSMVGACAIASGAMLVDGGGGGLRAVWLALLALQAVRALSIVLRFADVIEGSPLMLRQRRG